MMTYVRGCSGLFGLNGSNHQVLWPNSPILRHRLIKDRINEVTRQPAVCVCATACVAGVVFDTAPDPLIKATAPSKELSGLLTLSTSQCITTVI